MFDDSQKPRTAPFSTLPAPHGMICRVIVPRTSRPEILAKLRAKIERRVPLFIASAGSGLVAQLLEKAGADCINTFSGARLRANGMGTMSMLWPILDSNKQTLDYTEQDIMPALKGDAFVCACVNANDPLRDMVMVIERCKAMGVFSISNIGPSISYVDKDSQIYRVLTKSGVTFDHEIELLKVAKEMGMVTIGLAFDEEDSCRMVEEAQPDVFCYHAGTTKGGLRGYDSGETIEETAARTEQANQQLRALKSDLILVAHGAAMETPEDAQYILRHTSCDGFWTGSSTERLPIERAVYATAKEFASLRFDAEAGA
ncbi:MAG: phosphoenolpyruvate hydrolase family protein [Planctomycetota bacterium]